MTGVNLERMKQLVTERFRKGRTGGPGVKDFERELRDAAEHLGVPAMTYQNYFVIESGQRGRIYVDQLVVVAHVLGVPVGELLDTGSPSARHAQFDSGLRTGYRLAVGDMHTALSRLEPGDVDLSDAE